MYDIFNLISTINHADVTFYGYRQARPKLYLVPLIRDDEAIQRVEKRLYEITKEQRDNHVLFEVKIDECSFVLQFTDNNMWIGVGIEKGMW